MSCFPRQVIRERWAGSSNDMFQAFQAFLQQYRPSEPSTSITGSCYVSQAAGEACSSQALAEDCGECDDHPQNRHHAVI